jgi:hypothetical protein
VAKKKYIDIYIKTAEFVVAPGNEVFTVYKNFVTALSSGFEAVFSQYFHEGKENFIH